MPPIEKVDLSEYVYLITGDRDWLDVDTMAKVMSTFPTNAVIVHGYADGADTVADIVATELGLRRIRCPAHWRHNVVKVVEVWGRCPIDCKEVCGGAAGPIRNHFMLDTYHPVIVHGFHNNIMESKGTREMLTYSQRRGVPTLLHTSDAQFLETPIFYKSRKSVKPVIPTVAQEFFDFEN